LPTTSGYSASTKTLVPGAFWWFLAAIPLVNAIAVPIGVLLAPWAKRRRLRKYLAVTTPKPKP
jgi:hypothetical protein